MRLETGLKPDEARSLARVALALESLPRMDQAFARAELDWPAVRAMASVATPQTEAEWVAYARCRPVQEVERRVASARAGERPCDHRWGGSPVRFPHRFNAKPELHQAIEALTEILVFKTDGEVTIEETIEHSVTGTVAREEGAPQAHAFQRAAPDPRPQALDVDRDVGQLWRDVAARSAACLPGRRSQDHEELALF